MQIHVVQQGETIQTIADYYGVPVARLILDNGLEVPEALVPGQSLVIAFPETIYTVKEGDTLQNIADVNGVTLMQLYRNNPFLSEREYIYPGETLVIQYNTRGKITTHGNTVPFINKDTLRKTLPYLTYLSILNYTATREGEITTYYDDTEVIQLAKEYGVMPLMLLTTLTIKGEANIEITYEILLNEDLQNKQIENVLNILKLKGYYGVNISFEYINVTNLYLYESYFSRMFNRLSKEGYLVFATVNFNITVSTENVISFERVNYSVLNQLVQNIIFMNYQWATSINPPSPISSIHNIDIFLNYVSNYISPLKEIVGIATIGYDWELPFSAGISNVYSLTPERAVVLARNVGAIIRFDEISQTPFFNYTVTSEGNQIAHIVWFIDARTIQALLDLAVKYQLHGIGIWNITIYNSQLWLIINSQFEIEKVLK
jgi:spore germination protein